MLTIGSFFAGVGGIDLGFMQTGHYKIVYANEVDHYPAETYDANFTPKIDIKIFIKLMAMIFLILM